MPKEQYYIEMMDRPWEEYTKPFRHDILRERIRITTECRDCDDLPKVEDAGRCMVDESGLAVQIMHNGLKVLYGRYYGSWMNRIIADLGGVHEPQEERVGQSASVDGLLVAQNPELPKIAPIAVSTTRALVTAHG